MTTKINLPEESGREGMEFWVPVPNTPEIFKNAALFQSTVTVHNRRNLETLTLCLSVDAKHSGNDAFKKR